jgi:hypothetical protein
LDRIWHAAILPDRNREFMLVSNFSAAERDGRHDGSQLVLTYRVSYGLRAVRPTFGGRFMSKLFFVAMSGVLALVSVHAIADDLQKQAELATMISIGNPNAAARGEAIAQSARSERPSAHRADADAHKAALELTIAAGNPNAPARGQAIAMSAASAAVSQPLRRSPALREQELDAMISAGNPNAHERGIAIARSGLPTHA